MKDLYTFHTNEADLDEWYLKVRGAYINILNRLDLHYRIVGPTAVKSAVPPAKNSWFFAKSARYDCLFRPKRFCDKRRTNGPAGRFAFSDGKVLSAMPKASKPVTSSNSERSIPKP